MPLIGPQFREIQNALLSGYPSVDALAYMVRVELNVQLDSVADGKNQTDRIFNLLTWAESQGRLRELIEAAIRGNSQNPELSRLAENLRRGDLPVDIDSPDAQDKSQHVATKKRQPDFIRLGAPFLGPIPFSSNEAAYFFGRSKQIQEVVRHVSIKPLLVINGRSGSGKTSILRAGVIPQVEAAGLTAIYASIVDSPRLDVLRAIQSISENASDIVSGIGLLLRQKGSEPLILIIDQAERCFTVSISRDERSLFWRDIARLISGEAEHRVNIVFVVRADWLYEFQTAVPLSDEVAIFSFIYLIEPLTAAQAREALSGPLSLFGVTDPNSVIEQVVADLTSSDGYINPPQLQIVGAAIYDHVNQKHQPGSLYELAVSDYQELEGASAILRQHLIKIVKYFGPKEQTCWQILFKMIGDDDLRISRHEDELRGNLYQAEFVPIINALVKNALVVRDISAADNTPVYILAHDFLVGEIKSHFEKDHRLQALRTSESYLNSGLRDSQHVVKSGRPEFLPMEKERYLYLWANRDAFDNLTSEANLYLFQSALYHGEESFAHWFAKLTDETKMLAIQYLVEVCVDQPGPLVDARLDATRKAVAERLSDVDNKLVLDALWPLVKHYQRYREHSDVVTHKANVGATEIKARSTRILWAMRRQLTSRQRAFLLPVLTRLWVDRHRSTIIGTASGALMLAIVLGATLLIRERLAGSWTRLPTLNAGQVSGVALSPRSPTTLFVATPRGSTREDASTVLQYSITDRTKNVIGKGISIEPIRTILAVENKGEIWLYAGVEGRGIYRWTDNEMGWHFVNRGITSYSIRNLVAVPGTPLRIYAGSQDFGGVFLSEDAGDNWRNISGETLFGVSVLSMASIVSNGAILVGSYDGRIFYRDPDDVEWSPVAAFPGEGAATSIAVEPKQGQFVYAGTSSGSIFLSNDGGIHWIWMSKIPGSFYVGSVAVKPGAPNIVYADSLGPGGNILWISEDYGSNWKPVPDSTFSRELKYLLTSAADADTLYSFGPAGLFTTHDQGRTWRYEQELGAPIAPVVRVVPSLLPGGATYLTIGGSAFTSAVQDVAQWYRSQNLPSLAVRIIVPDPVENTTAFAGVYLPNGWSVYETRDNGLTWQATSVPESIPERYLNDTMDLAVTWNDDEHVLYAGTNGCGVIKSMDGGKSWNTFGRTDCNLSSESPKNVIDLELAPDDYDKIYAAADGNSIYVSTNGGMNWRAQKLDNVTVINGMEVDPVIPGRVYVTAGSHGFWRSDDDGRSWLHFSNGIETENIITDMTVAKEKGEIYLLTATGLVYKSSNGGETWQNINRNLSITIGTDIAYEAYSNGLLIAALFDGVHRFTPGSLLGDGR